MPRRDGPYIVLSQRSPTTFVVASCDKPDEPLGVYHTSALTPFLNGTETQSPVVPLKKRGRPRKQPLVPRGTAGENAIRSASTPLAETVFGGINLIPLQKMAVGSLEVRASDFRPEGLVPCLNCGGGDRWCGHLSLFQGISPSLFKLSPVWCSRPWPTTGVLLAPFQDEFRGSRSDYVRQVALATTTVNSDPVSSLATDL
ncbi:retrovirus-related Pol polyprotein from transposon 412 [Trichonephila clavipes]|nr:retrovirus-related Pol polyprotein from transposon 412 [Trichonephila clavipes]